MPKPFKTEQTGDRQTNQLQDNFKAATNTLRAGPFGDGNLVKGVVIANNTIKVVNTGLGRAHQGFIIVRLINLALGGAVAETANTDSTVTFYSYGDSTVDIWFF